MKLLDVDLWAAREYLRATVDDPKGEAFRRFILECPLSVAKTSEQLLSVALKEFQGTEYAKGLVAALVAARLERA